MLASVKKSTKKLKDKVYSAANTTNRWVRKHRKKIGIISAILFAIVLITVLILIAYKGVDITSQAVIINHT
jgi:hypothetical protein